MSSLTKCFILSTLNGTWHKIWIPDYFWGEMIRQLLLLFTIALRSTAFSPSSGDCCCCCPEFDPGFFGCQAKECLFPDSSGILLPERINVLMVSESYNQSYTSAFSVIYLIFLCCALKQ